MLAIGTPEIFSLASGYALFPEQLPMRLIGVHALDELTPQLERDVQDQLTSTGGLMKTTAETGIRENPSDGDRIQISWVAGWDAIRSLAARDLVGQHDGWTQDIYDHLTRHWRLTVGELHPDDLEFPNSWFTIQPGTASR
jgi:hypothetical protein